MRGLLKVAAVLAVAAAITVVVIEVRKKKLEADAALDDIETQLDELDPITRRAVVAKLAADAVRPS